MNEIMLDLETLGVEPGCVILSIGAVLFNDKQIGPSFYQIIDLENSIEQGFTIRPKTLKWWFGQSQEALTLFSGPGCSLSSALDLFYSWVKDNVDDSPVVWGNGSDFDNAILAEAYKRLGKEKPWGHFANRCFRTMKSEFPEIPISREGTHHNALDDATTQAKHLIKLRNLCIP